MGDQVTCKGCGHEMDQSDVCRHDCLEFKQVHCTKCDDIISTRQIAVMNVRQIRLGKPPSVPKVCATCILNGIMTARPEEDAMDTARDAIVEAAKARRVASNGQRLAVTWDEREQFWKDLGRADYEQGLAVDALVALEEAAEQAAKKDGDHA